MNRETLMHMPIFQLRGLDIKTKEDELLVQEILNEKLQSEPNLDPNRVILSSSETDGLTPEKEKELQAKLDGENEEIGEPSEGTGHAPIIEETEEFWVPQGEDYPSEVPETEPEPVEEEIVNKAFCEFCDSKGVRHKKDCTRPQ